jgi:hypothetical protein
MLLRERVAVYCENHTEHINTFCMPNAEFQYVTMSVCLLNFLLVCTEKQSEILTIPTSGYVKKC